MVTSDCFIESFTDSFEWFIQKCWFVHRRIIESFIQHIHSKGSFLCVFQTGYIALRRELRSENNHGCHIEGSFQTQVLKISHFKGPFGIKDFEGYNRWTLRAHMILCAESLHDDGAFMWAWWCKQKGFSRNSCLVPYTLQPFETLSPEGNSFEGIRAKGWDLPNGTLLCKNNATNLFKNTSWDILKNITL